MIQHQNDHPPSFICPLTYEVMEEPVMDRCAHNFEKNALLEWLGKGHECCPISRKPLTSDDLVPNHALAEQIERWNWKRENQPALLRNLGKNRSIQHGSDGDDGDNDDETDTTQNDDTATTQSNTFEDEEMGEISSSRKNHLFMTSAYDHVPNNEMMLLPQERRALEVMHHQEEMERQQKRRRCLCKSCLIFVCLNVGVLTVFELWLHFGRNGAE